MKETANQQNALLIRNLSKTYANGVQALNDISLTIPQGMYGLLGPNGAGKSTLMRTLATLQEPDKGTIMLGDMDVLRQKDELRRTLGYLPQEFGVYPGARAHELLDHFAILKRYYRPCRQEIDHGSPAEENQPLGCAQTKVRRILRRHASALRRRRRIVR